MKSKNNTINYQQAVLELQRIGDWIRWSASVFVESGVYFGHGTDNAWDEAVHLVLGLLHLPLNSDRAIFDAIITTDERNRLVTGIKARVEDRKPLPYITHEAWCMGMPFYVDERALIPRSPFGEWIEQRFSPWLKPENVHAILEIGTGSACLAIACALQFPETRVVATDVSEAALAVAQMNIENYGLEDQINLIQSNCFQEVKGKFDIIFSNPPYVSDQEMQTLPPEYQHEPQLALEANDDGLAIVITLLKEAGHYLNPNGVLVVEVGNSDEALAARFPDVPFLWLEQERGGHGLFMLTKQQLKEINNDG